jgi:hypothetical protein
MEITEVVIVMAGLHGCKNTRKTQRKAPLKKAECVSTHSALSKVFGRLGGIRTRDPLHPMQVRYQAALQAETDSTKNTINGAAGRN